MIDEILVFLNNTFENEGYYVKEFSDELFFGKDKDNNIICAKMNSLKEPAFSLKTKAIDLYQNYHFILKTDEEEVNANFDMLILKNDFIDTKDTFVKLCLNFYNQDLDKGIIELTYDLIEMYKVALPGDHYSEQGLWGELFTILYLKNNYDVNIAKYWHNDNFNKYDFSFGEKYKLEVKSTTKESREHRFSHEQLFTDYDVIVSSVQMRKDDNGYSVLDVYKEVESLFSSKYDLLIKVEKVLSKIDKENMIRYDFEYANNNIKFYLNKEIPHFDSVEPDGVHGTEYTVVLENEKDIGKKIKIYLERIENS